MNKKIPSKFRRTAIGLLAMVCGAAAAQPYQPEQAVSGDIRVWASPDDGALLQSWAEGFRKLQPQTRVLATLHGPESTMAGVYNGVADLAFLARELREPVEDMAFTWVYLYKPFSVEIANAGLRPGRPSTNLAVYVNRGNPLSHLTLQQLDGVFGAEHRRGERNLRNWGDLGLDGNWKDRAIHVCGPAADSIQAIFFRTLVLRDSYKWNADYHELPAAGAQAPREVAADPAAICFGPVAPGDDTEVKMLALADSPDGPYERPTPASIANRSYPLARVVTMVLNRAPGKAIAPAVKEFLRYILSDEAQVAVARDGNYIPLNAESARRQLARLE